ncbi:TetR/AcrR family transcriptional regulator [Branchiibius sp. NY16-3462-2]|uniref:TetR/AcrR family transcriptional regulator n=1 Tax=Branchiibius sp. NY16-3462-2 TaxID=1807500 RepID=UPI000796FC14|nr:TetR/AcrR family transcriptional regulator [Branchiibius sp. NY16-3462-2]KYH46284.1 TetR family transcriptional regulator [Branchiibius sp. NY16-3462-2]
MSNTPRTARGERTRQKLLAAAEQVFAEQGYHDASVARITEVAGVGMGTFYLYFDTKLEVFDQVVEDLNRRVRRAMYEASSTQHTRAAAERAGFAAFFKFTAEHPALYRLVRQAEFVSPAALNMHYSRIVDGYTSALQKARDNGEIGDVDPTVAAWALMGIGEIIGMRWVLWGAGGQGDLEDPTSEVPDDVFEQMMRFIERALAVPADQPTAEETP